MNKNIKIILCIIVAIVVFAIIFVLPSSPEAVSQAFYIGEIIFILLVALIAVLASLCKSDGDKNTAADIGKIIFCAAILIIWSYVEMKYGPFDD